ncbi:MAG: TonB family protein [Acidobacteria bacterium]|nr:TonB family protein [Acidobacteriota bacterium]MCA1642141.1 TonB family protein [Acidobacteriota bacterium]
MRCSNCGNDLPGGVRFCPKCGAPSAPATSPVSPPQSTTSFGSNAPQQSSGSGMVQPKKKSGCGKALLIFAIIGVLLAAVLGGLAYYGYHFASDKLKSSEAYTVAVSALKESPQVAEKLGAITETGFPLGSFHEETGGTGAAAYHMSVKGTKSSGTYDVVMSRRAGKWYLTSGRLKLDSGETINLRAPDTSMPGDDSSDDNSNASSTPGRIGAGKIVAGGMLAGKATSMPAPAYPQIAKAAKAAGAVVVLVVADEDGEVESAKAISGHPLLKASAEAAAKQARFTPMVVAGKTMKMTGTITYNFVSQ